MAPLLRGFAVLLAVGVGSFLTAAPAGAQEIPPPVPNMQVIKTGSLVIAMDNDKQNVLRPFNTRAYGLAVALLYDSIPVKWVIRSGKAKDGIDFTATATRYAPDTVAASSLDFRGGPFVIDRAYAAKARTRILAWNAASTAKVRVYQLTQDITADVRYTLHFRPFPFVNSTNTALAADILLDAGFSTSWYHVGPNGDVLGNACYTILLEPHNTNTSDSAQVRQFVQSGGNFYAQCASVNAFENAERFATTGGFTTNNVGTVPTYPNPDLGYSQLIGAVEPAPGGSEQDYQLATNSALRSWTSIHLQDAAGLYAAVQAKTAAGVGGLVFYNGGHNITSTTDLAMINLQRLMLNAVLTPASRPTVCNFDIPTPDLTISKTHTGNFAVGVNGTYTINVSNISTNSPTLDTVYVRDTLPTGLTYVSATGSGWIISVTGNVVVAKYGATIPIGGSASFSLVVLPGPSSVGSTTNRAWVNGGGEANDTNNGASDPTTVLGPGVSVTPDNAGPVLRLPSNGVEYSYTFKVYNTGGAPSAYTLIASLGAAGTPFLSIDSVRGPTVTSGARADSAQLATLAAGDSATVTVFFKVAEVAAGLEQMLMLRATSTTMPSITDPGSALIKVTRPQLAIQKQVAPTGTQLPGTDLNYTVTVQNVGTDSAVSVVVIDSLPTQVMFKLGSLVSTVPAGTTTVEYSNDAGATWSYTPVSAGCSAPAGYDACVTRIRWTMSNALAFASGTNTASHVLVARLR